MAIGKIAEVAKTIRRIFIVFNVGDQDFNRNVGPPDKLSRRLTLGC